MNLLKNLQETIKKLLLIHKGINIMTILHTIGISVVKVLLSMLTELFTETFLKAIIIEALQMLVDRTDNEWDNRLLEKAKESWSAK